LLEDEEKAMLMAKNARSRIKNSFDINTVLEKNIEIYQSVKK